MPDRYQKIVTSGPGRFVARRLGLPMPAPLRRYRSGDPEVPGPVLIGSPANGDIGSASDGLVKAAADVVTGAGAEVLTGPTAHGEPGPHALVFDASTITDLDGLRALYDFFHPNVRSVRRSGRLVVLGRPPESCAEPEQAIAQRALEGFVRSLGKEARGGTTAQLLYVEAGAEAGMASTLRFVLSAKSAYVSGQVIRVGAGAVADGLDWGHPLAGKTALVTGAARGIGVEIAKVLARDGARVICLDLPGSESLAPVAAGVGGEPLELDIAAADGPTRLADELANRHGGIDIVVHNAGIIRDRTLARMGEDRWDSVLAVNLASQYRINGVLVERDLLRPGGRIVSLSSVSGIAGNVGQTNYATSKAGVIGLVQALAPALAERGATINAIAPGFIETRLTAQIPVLIREAGRRMNSMAQGGLPVDVAETVAWLAHPGSAGVTGQVVRVCGQSLLGA